MAAPEKDPDAVAHAPARAAETLAAFFRARGLEATPATPAQDAAELARDGYVRRHARRPEPRGARRDVVAIVLAPGSPYVTKMPRLRALLAAAEGPPVRPDELDELIVVAPEEFFGKKLLTDALRRHFAARAAAGPGREAAPGAARDPTGLAPYYTAVPYYVFYFEVPRHVAVPRHRVMSAEEVEAFLAGERLTIADLPEILSCDPAVVWAGGRVGDVVEISRDSFTVFVAVYYRRVVYAFSTVPPPAGRGAGDDDEEDGAADE